MTKLTQQDIRRPFVIVRHNGRRGTLTAVSTDTTAQTATVVVDGTTNVLPASDVICGTCGDTVDACTRSLIHEQEHERRWSVDPTAHGRGICG